MSQRRRVRRFWHDDEKRRIVAQTRMPGVSVSQVARRYDVNANLAFTWLRDPRYQLAEDDTGRFLPVEVVPERVPQATDGRIEIVLSNGHRVSVSGAFDPDAISRLVRGLAP
jgi:transposase